MQDIQIKKEQDGGAERNRDSTPTENETEKNKSNGKRKRIIIIVVIVIAASFFLSLKFSKQKNNDQQNNEIQTQVHEAKITKMTDEQRWEVEKNINNAIELVFSFNEKNANVRFKKFFDNYADPDQKDSILRLLSDKAKKLEGTGVKQFFEEDEIKILDNRYQVLVKGSIIKILNREVTSPKIIYLNVIYRILNDKFYVFSINTLNADDYDELIEKDANIHGEVP